MPSLSHITTSSSLLLLLLALVGACKSAPDVNTTPPPKQEPSAQERRQALIDASTPAGAQASWFLSLFEPANASYSLTSEELAQHFSSDFLQRDNSASLIELLHTQRVELLGLVVEEVLRDRRHDIMLRASRAEPEQEHPSRWILAVSVSEQPPFLIEGLILQRDEFDEQLHASDEEQGEEPVEKEEPSNLDYGISPNTAPYPPPEEDDSTP